MTRRLVEPSEACSSGRCQRPTLCLRLFPKEMATESRHSTRMKPRSGLWGESGMLINFFQFTSPSVTRYSLALRD
jgi:hypothetical protein